MKQFLSVSIVLLSACSVFAYQDADITTANSLASQNIIVDQSQSPDKYNLDAKILRQEVIAMALKFKGITLPENYSCKGYYSDTKKNDWVCRAVEIAADNGIITRANKQANPTQYITWSEALAMMMRAGWISIEQYTSPDRNLLFITQGATSPKDWQIDVMNSAMTQGIIYPYVINQEGFESPYLYSWNYNDFILRREVFDFTQEIFTEKTYTTYSFPGEYTVQYEKGMKVITNKDMVLFQDKDVTYSIFKQKRTCDAPCGDGYYNALQFDGKGVTNYNMQYPDDWFFSEIIVEWKSGKSKWFSRTIALPDVAYNIKAITKEENYDAQAERLKRFVWSIVFYNWTPAEQEQKRNWEILQSYLAIQLKTMAANPKKATVEMCFQILDGVPGTDSYSVYEIHNTICGGDPLTSPHYWEFHVGGQRVYKNEFTLEGEDNWVMMD